MRIERLSLDEWDDHLPDGGFEPFHTAAALRVLDDHAPGDLRLYGGFKGDRASALLPVFVRKRSLGRAIFSPPPGFAVGRLGPVVMPHSPKRRKRDRLNRTFVEEVLDELDAGSRLTLCRVQCHPAYEDPRPFRWYGLDVGIRFTYSLDVSGDPEDLLRAASKSLRREVRAARETDVEVEVGGREAALEIHRATGERYAEQGEEHPVSWPYVRDLVDALDDRSRTYVARDPDGEFLSGVTVLYSNDAAHFWQGGARATYDGAGVNDLLHWRIVEDIADGDPFESLGAYDLMGANTERLCRYKSKFGADLRPFYVAETEGPGMSLAKGAYRLAK